MNPNTSFTSAPPNTPLFNLLERLAKNGGDKFVARFIHSQLANLLVAATPNPIDDAILAALQQAIPKP